MIQKFLFKRKQKKTVSFAASIEKSVIEDLVSDTEDVDEGEDEWHVPVRQAIKHYSAQLENSKSCVEKGKYKLEADVHVDAPDSDDEPDIVQNEDIRDNTCVTDNNISESARDREAAGSIKESRTILEQFGNVQYSDIATCLANATLVYKEEIFKDDYQEYVNPYPETYEPIESPPSPAPWDNDKDIKHRRYKIIYHDDFKRVITKKRYENGLFVNLLEYSPTNILGNIREKQKSENKTKKRYLNMTELVEEDRKLIIEFCHLLDKAKQLFNGLRELPQYGHKQWHSYFGRTFDVYTKLWKFQQQHRAVLDSKYGLKRWQIGEIASKIGQLYYHFYLRTSECAYLNEAFAFYSAIRGRSYYTKACKEDKCELIVKKLRYYARFIVVCLLLKKNKLVRELIKELERQIAEYGNTYDPDDQIEWTLVVDEVKAFIQAEEVVSILHPENYPVILSHRLTIDTVPSIERTTQMAYNLQEAMIIGNRKYQIKFSELAIDMFRILQTLERDPLGNAQHIYDGSPRLRFASTPNAPTTKGYLEEAARRESANPHKILLYKPAANQALVYTGSGVLDLLPNGALLLYISGDGYTCPTTRSPEPGYDMGGVLTTSKADVYREGKDQKTQTKFKEVQCIYPGDLYQFSRSPMFIIIDSDNSFAFANMPKVFGYPQVTLMSPTELPAPYQDHKHQGSLFTLFLHAPLVAFCYVCEIRNTTLVHWERALILVDNFLINSLNILMRNRPDSNYIAFIGDEFMRLLILRYIFCETTLRLHRAFRSRNTLPRCSPHLPEEMIDHPALTGIILDIATHFQVRNQFDDIGAAGPAPKD